MREKLWTKNFTIVTLGSFVSMIGHCCVNYALSFLAYDRTESAFLYSLMLLMGILPQMFVPVFAGAFLDRHSRAKTIYTIDFIYTCLFAVIALLLFFDLYIYWLFLIITFIFGSLNAFYGVAYDSLFPNVITASNYRKAYAFGSLLYPVANTLMAPVSAIVYKSVGLVPLFAGSVILFLVTAIWETHIDAPEPHLTEIARKKANGEHIATLPPLRQFSTDLKFGIKYIIHEKGLMIITAYFFFTTLAGAVLSTSYLPFFKKEYADGLNLFAIFGISGDFIMDASLIYSVVMGFNTVGRLLGGIFHYNYKIPTKYKFVVALSVYITLGVLNSFELFSPLIVIIIVQILSGALAVNSYNIRISATQNYIPDSVRGRFNATFALITNSGNVIGLLVAGMLDELYYIPYIVLGAQIINMLAILLIMYAGRKYVKPIYNC
ncbi:MAG: MFS transporter, partial [Clostridia bacterium]